MIYPALHGGVYLRQADLAPGQLVDQDFEPPLKLETVAPLEPPVRRIHPEAEKREAARHRVDLRPLLVQSEPPIGQALDDGFAPGVKLRPAVAEEQKIIHVAKVAGALQFAPDKMIEVVEVDVGPELRCQVADGQAARAQGGQQVVAGKYCLTSHCKTYFQRRANC